MLPSRSESTVEDVARRYAQEATCVSGTYSVLMNVWLRGYRNEPLASESESEAVMLAWNAGRRFYRKEG